MDRHAEDLIDMVVASASLETNLTRTICFAINDAFVLPLAVALQSLAHSDPSLAVGLDVFVLVETLEPGSRMFLHRVADASSLNLEIINVELMAHEVSLAKGGTRSHYLRLLIPTVKQLEGRVLYLDADILVRHSLRELLATPLGSSGLAAVRDQIVPQYRFAPWASDWGISSFEASDEYFNSGVLLLDLEQCADLFSDALELATSMGSRLRMWDQDALNIAAGGSWVRLPAKWNAFPMSCLTRTPWVRYAAHEVVPLDDLVALEEVCCVMHYVSPSKPWLRLLPEGKPSVEYRRALAEMLAT